MALRTLHTALGACFLDDGPTGRVGIEAVRIVGRSGCDPIAEWDLDLQEAILAACSAAGVTPRGAAPGAWEVPREALGPIAAALTAHAVERAAALRATGQPRRVQRG